MMKIRYRIPEAHCISLPTKTDGGADIKSAGAFFYQDQIYIFEIRKDSFFDTTYVRCWMQEILMAMVHVRILREPVELSPVYNVYICYMLDSR